MSKEENCNAKDWELFYINRDLKEIQEKLREKQHIGGYESKIYNMLDKAEEQMHYALEEFKKIYGKSIENCEKKRIVEIEYELKMGQRREKEKELRKELEELRKK